MQTESLYWLFSSSAQSISTLVAFLIAGLALVQAMMENAQQKDDTLVDIHSQLQTVHYRAFKLLAIGTGLSVGFSLGMLIANANSFPGKMLIAGVVILLNMVVLGGAIGFVLLIVDPARYQVTAKKIMEQDRKDQKLPEPAIADKDFFAEFIKLEASVREIVKRKHLYLSSQGSARMVFSFRQMVDTLYQSELISPLFYDELQQINRYRNLVFHGQAHETDKDMVDRIKAATTRVLEVAPKRTTSKRTKSRRAPAPADSGSAAEDKHRLTRNA
jgi:hypothetical protein